MDELWLILIATLVGVSCSLVGCFIVLRRLSMLGDAISHTVLFGVVIGVFITGTWSGPVMLFFAALAGVLTSFATEFLTKYGKLSSDASVGVVFTWLFAIAIILLSVYTGDAHIDLECVLFGELAFQPLNTLSLAGVEVGPKAFWSLLAVSLLNSVVLLIGFRSLKTTAFDKALAVTIGVNIGLWHYILMLLVSITTVVNLEAVGAILVVAMLVVPANTAYLISKSVSHMIIGSIVFSVLSAILGIWMANYFNASPSAGVALASGVFFILVLVGKGLRGSLLKNLQPAT